MSVKRHTAYNVAGAVVPLLGMLVTLPFYLEAIGEERYGVLAILWTLLGYFGLFDLGLGRAVTNRIAAFRDRTQLQREQVFWTALLMNMGLGGVGAVALWATGSLLFRLFIDVPGPLVPEVMAALPWLVAAFPVLLVSSVLSGALMGRERFLAQNAVRIAEGLLVQVVPLTVALSVGPALPALAAAVIGVRVLSGIALFGLCVRTLPVGLRPVPAAAHVRPLFGYGGWVTVTSIVGPLLSTLDRVLIGAIAGVRAVTYYTVPFGLASRISIIPGSLSSALFPRFSALAEPERDALLDTGVRSLAAVITPLAVGGLLIMEPFLTLWIDAEFAVRAAPVGEIIVIGIWANSVARLPFAHIQARGRPDLTAKFHLAELAPYLVVLWLALEWKGAVGAALAWSLRVWVDAGLMFAAARFPATRALASGAVVLAVATGAVLLTAGTEAAGIFIRSAVLVAAVGWAWLTAPAALRDLLTAGIQRVPGLGYRQTSRSGDAE